MTCKRKYVIRRCLNDMNEENSSNKNSLSPKMDEENSLKKNSLSPQGGRGEFLKKNFSMCQDGRGEFLTKNSINEWRNHTTETRLCKQNQVKCTDTYKGK